MICTFLTLKGLESYVYDQIPGITADRIILVPERRNTLPHTLWALQFLGDEPVLFKSVDHYLRDPDTALASLSAVIEKYETKDSSITLLCNKVQSYHANNGYVLADKSNRIIEFVEKPTEQAFEQLSRRGMVYESSMIYIGGKKEFLAALKTVNAHWARAGERLLAASAKNREQAFLDMPMLDISSSLFQGAQNLRINLIDYDYVDVGRYEALYELNTKDAHGNAILGNVIVTDDCHHNFIVNQLNEPLVVMGTDNMAVVQTAQGSVITPLAQADAVGALYKERIHKSQT